MQYALPAIDKRHGSKSATSVSMSLVQRFRPYQQRKQNEPHL